MNKGRIYFNHYPKPTIGVEAELFTISKDSLDLCPIAEDLGCRKELIQLGDIVENNQAPYQRQIMQYNKDNEFSDIILSAINDLEKGMVAVL
jgi:hypothetical protein